jgi:antitoxin component YwqK of YwqJK toxin-antitoxin module
MNSRALFTSVRFSWRPGASVGWLLVPVLWLCGCEQEEPRRVLKSGPDVEVRADGLTYEVGAASPFSGAVRRYLPKSDSMITETLYADGKPDGYARRWFRENPGQLSHQQLWVRGDPVFTWRWWPNGNLKELSSQRNGLKDLGRPDIAFGSYVKWFEDGRFKFKAHYDDQFRWHGHVIDYDDEGKLMWDAEFDHGVYVSGHRPAEEPAPAAR